MKYKTAFRLALRLVGVFTIVSDLPWFLRCCFSFFGTSVLGNGTFGTSVGYDLSYGLSSLAGILIGVYLARGGGQWIVNHAIPSNRPYCHDCGYELTGAPPEGICPECGTAFRRA